MRHKTLVKAVLHYGDYRSKLVPFEAHKNEVNEVFKKGPSLEQFMPECKQPFRDTLHTDRRILTERA
jgi:hypothetical protein